MSVEDVTATTETGSLFSNSVEINGINVIAESERKGRPSDLFWPWFGANVSVFGISYGAFILGFGVSFWQAVIAGVIGIVLSFLFCGIVAIAGKRGSAPTLVMSRAAFGIDGNKLPATISWLLTVGWETVLVVLATLATSTVFEQLGWGGGTATRVVALIVVVALTVGAGVIGFDLIMKLQRWITWITGVLTVVYLILSISHIDWAVVSALPSGTTEQFIGALVMVLTGFGLGWVNAAADYSRYLPRSASTRGVVGWTTVGGAAAPIVLVVFGLLLAGSSADLSAAISADPIGALASLLPTWFLVLFVIVAVLGLVGGSVLDIYSSGLALLTLGLRIPRWSAALVDGVIMLIGAVYVVFFAKSFLGPFQGFLITLGVPVAAWAGVMMVDIALRRKDYADAELYERNGRYGSVRWVSVVLVLVGTAIGWGLVVSPYVSDAQWLAWQGYLLGPLGLGGRDGAWAYANVGVLVALAIGALGTVLFSRREIRAQER